MEEAFDTYSGLGGTGNVSKRIDGGQVARELERQNMATTELHGALEHLEERLGPLRLAKPETAGPDRGQPDELRAELAQVIANGTASVVAATRRLQTLLHELEL